MTSPADPTAMLSQILLKQGEMGEKLAVIAEQLKQIPDHELRLRQLEQWRWKATGIAIAAGSVSGAVAALIDHLKLH